MRFLFDTNVWLWWTQGNSARISADLKREIQSLDIQVFVSIASIWEIAIKSSLGKMSFPANPGAFVQPQVKRQQFKLLHIDLDDFPHRVSKSLE